MRATVIILLLVCAAGAVLAQDATWLARYDEINSGVTDAGLELPVSLLWKHTTGDDEATVVATPAIGPDMVYAPVGHSIYAIDRVTGELVWEQSAGGEIYSSPALADGILYFGSRDGNLWAVNAEDGSVEWRYPTGGPVDCSPVIAYGVCYFGSDANRLIALDLETRQPIWQFETAGDIKASPLVYRDVVVVGCQERRIYCLNAQGQPMWSQALERKACFAAPVGERTKVVYSSGRQLEARDIYTGRVVWARPFRAADLIVGSPCVRGRRVYIGTMAGAVYCIDANRGAAIWRWPAQGVADPITTSPVIVNDMIVFKAGERDLIALSLDGQRVLWQYTLPQAEEKGTTPQGVGGGMIPGDEGFMGIAPGEGPVMPGGEQPGGPGGAAQQRQERSYEFEDNIDPSVAVVDNAVYTIGEDNVIYGFETEAPDNVPPRIAEPLLEVPGARRMRVQFVPALADEDDFPEHYADEIAIPGTPPVFLSLVLTDEGSGVDPESVRVTVNGEVADHSYDQREGLIWYIYDPRGAAANLSNGIKRVLFEAMDWRGNRVAQAVSFTIDNRLGPPEPPQPERPTLEGMPGMPGMPGEEFPPGMMPPPEPMP